MLAKSLYNLRNALRTYVSSHAPDIENFCGKALRSEHQETHFIPASSHISERLTNLDGDCSVETKPIFDAIVDAAGDVTWRQSYTTDDTGFDAHYLANYAWFNLISPSGPFVSEDMRLSIGYWEKGLTYPNHWHEPEEIYLTIAGNALYISEGRTPVRGGPGARIQHVSNQQHSAKFDESPLLAAAFWRGKNLEGKSCIGAKP